VQEQTGLRFKQGTIDFWQLIFTNYSFKILKTMKKKSLFVLMAAAGLSSCSKSDIATPLDGDDAEIALRSSVINVNTASSRVAYEGVSLATEPLTALVLTSESSKNYETPYGVGTMTFSGTGAAKYNKPVWSGEYKFKDYDTAPNTDHHLTGLYPPTPLWEEDGGSYKLDLTGKEDVMLAPQITTNYTEAKAENYQNLVFSHKLTLLKLKFIKEDIADFDITVKDARVVDALGDLKRTAVAKISQPDQKVEFEGQAQWIGSYAVGTDNTLASSEDIVVPIATTNEQAYILLPPVDASNADDAYEYEFRIFYTDEDGIDTSTYVKVDLVTDATGQTKLNVNSANYANTITFNFIDGNIKCTASVTGWTYGGVSEYPI
jgi:hypothetical protein